MQRDFANIFSSFKAGQSQSPFCKNYFRFLKNGHFKNVRFSKVTPTFFFFVKVFIRQILFLFQTERMIY